MSRSNNDRRSVLRATALVAAVLAVYAAMASSPTAAARRLMRRIGVDDGLPVAGVHGIAQDGNGYLWLGTLGGLVRYDGQKARVWTSEPYTRVFPHLVDGEGVVHAHDERGRLVRVVDGGVAPVRGPRGEALRELEAAAFARDGALWIARGRVLHRRTPAGVWRDVSLPESAKRPLRLRPARGDAMWVATEEHLWLVRADGSFGRLVEVERLRDVVDGPGHRVFVLDWPGEGRLRTLDASTGAVDVLYTLDKRPIDLLKRGDSLWVSFDHALVAMPANRDPVVLGPGEGITSAGRLALDREGALWMASYEGAVQMPEPDTEIWTSRDGLPDTVARFLGHANDAVWITAWDGSARLHASRPEEVETWHDLLAGRGCQESEGRAWFTSAHWASDRPPLLSHELETFTGHAIEVGGAGCARSSASGLWMAGEKGLFWIVAGERGPRRVDAPPSALAHYPPLVEDRAQRIWVGTTDGVCRADARAVAEGRDAEWECAAPPGAERVVDLAETPAGTIVAATRREGLFVHDQERWERASFERRLSCETLEGVSAAPREGLWVFGRGCIARLQERPEARPVFEIVETLTSWHGLPGRGATDVLELDDGSVFVASHVVARVPPRARFGRREPPPVLITSIEIGGEPVSPAERIEVPFRDNQIALRFAAPSFRDPNRLRYRLRLRADTPWTETSDDPAFHLGDLSPGSYRIAVQASLDGHRWSDPPARLALVVLRPWYARSWFVLLVAAALGLAGYVIHRVRVGVVRRLERQRLRIAMDLHDEIGSGLGSVGIMGELVAERGLDAEDRGEVGRRIANAAQEMGGSLADIVWALREDSGDLAAVVRHVSERSQAIFPDARVRFTLPPREELARVGVSVPVRRAVTQIAFEALHNVLKHADASDVEIGLRREGRRWRFWIRDDGEGFAPDDVDGDGLGLTSIEARARQIGAEIDISSRPGEGTLVMLRFSPRAIDERIAP